MRDRAFYCLEKGFKNGKIKCADDKEDDFFMFWSRTKFPGLIVRIWPKNDPRVQKLLKEAPAGADKHK